MSTLENPQAVAAGVLQFLSAVWCGRDVQEGAATAAAAVAVCFLRSVENFSFFSNVKIEKWGREYHIGTRPCGCSPC